MSDFLRNAREWVPEELRPGTKIIAERMWRVIRVLMHRNTAVKKGSGINGLRNRYRI